MLRLENLGKRFDDTVAVDDLTLEVGKGEFLSLLGPSGCGKTTTLRMIAGFEVPTSGRILLDGRDVTALPPQRRGTGMVFQSYALFPHLDVFENVAFGLRARGAPAAGIPAQVSRALARVDLSGYEKRSVQALSGGQQQRVALARALAPEPPVLLLDEPLSNLDAALRERTRGELRALLKEVGITAVFVTHDQEEAFHLSDRIAVLDRGRLQQVGTPEELYHQPANAFVAAFVGQANFLEGTIVEWREGCALCELPGGARWCVSADSLAVGSRVRVMTRPESLRLTDEDAAGAGALRGRVVDRRFAGGSTYYRVDLGGAGEVVAAVTGRPAVAQVEQVGVELVPGGTARAFPPSAP
ncbi:MAG TPA: ABC transporter ATP-binding protein [Longimicrobiaceae bacterium]